MRTDAVIAATEELLDARLKTLRRLNCAFNVMSVPQAVGLGRSVIPRLADTEFVANTEALRLMQISAQLVHGLTIKHKGLALF